MNTTRSTLQKKKTQNNKKSGLKINKNFPSGELSDHEGHYDIDGVSYVNGKIFIGSCCSSECPECHDKRHFKNIQ